MKKYAVVFFYSLLSSCIAFSQEKPPVNEDAAPVDAIPYALVEAQFNQCTSEFKSLGKQLVGSYCQCVSNKFYQNLRFQAYMRYTEALRNHEKAAIDYKNKTTADCLANTASHVGKPGLPF